MLVMPNRDPAVLEPEDEEMLEQVVAAISQELGQSVIARGVNSIDYRTYCDAEDRPCMFEFTPRGRPQVPIQEFERVLAMRFVQIMWETRQKRCLALGLDPKDDRFRPWPDGAPDYILGLQDNPDAVQALPDGLLDDTAPSRPTPGRNDPCPCGSGLKYKNCCMRL